MLDLAQEWREQDKSRRKPDEVAYWNNRARSYTFKDAPGSYVRQFIDKMQLAGPGRILDMGCGTGSLSLPLAKAGNQVIAADFSEGMLARIRENCFVEGVPLLAGSEAALMQGWGLSSAEAETAAAQAPAPGQGGVTFKAGVAPVKMSWEDDWEQVGLGPNSVDYAVASRSIITHDLEDSIRKLSAVARKRVFVTAVTGYSPRVDERAAKAMGLTLKRHNDALFVFGIASDLGYEPTVSYIYSPRSKMYDSYNHAFDSLMETVRYVDDRAQQVPNEVAAQRLRDWLDVHLVPCVAEDGGQKFRLDEPRVIPWAFISWEV